MSIPLTLAHSPDPDDAFMWWPLTGKINPDGTPQPGAEGTPRLDTGRFSFRALPADIHVLNRRAIERADLEITALSARAYCDVKDRYIITRCGGSFGDGYGPKLIARSGSTLNSMRAPTTRIAVPGMQTTAFLLLGLALGFTRDTLAAQRSRFIELPFEQIIGAVARGDADAGLVIHEGQLTFVDAGLQLLLDVGVWWKQRTGLLTPLGVNAVRRDLDQLHGPGTVREVAALLSRSVAYSMDHRDESTRYTLPFALANVDRAGKQSEEKPTLERIERYCKMYVTEETRDMGEKGRQAIERLLRDGAAAGLCPDPGTVDVV
ncbi:MAG: ABC transporter substrate-binding protein [Phycisphaerales bacterium]|nr:ABC transporter substrate-binding protein [Phycisphaerales bacterium]